MSSGRDLSVQPLQPGLITIVRIAHRDRLPIARPMKEYVTSQNPFLATFDFTFSLAHALGMKQVLQLTKITSTIPPQVTYTNLSCSCGLLLQD
jgi:hypothetical protein